MVPVVCRLLPQASRQQLESLVAQTHLLLEAPKTPLLICQHFTEECVGTTVKRGLSMADSTCND